MNRPLFLIVLLLWIQGCASPQRISRLQGKRQLLFPPGLYQHRVSLKTPKEDSREFDGMVRIKKDLITVVGLSHFQTTVFKIQENIPQKKVDTQIYFDPLKKFKPQFEGFYKILSALFKTKYDAKNLPNKLSISAMGNQVILTIKDYDENNIPLTLKIRHPKWQVTVKVVGYEI